MIDFTDWLDQEGYTFNPDDHFTYWQAYQDYEMRKPMIIHHVMDACSINVAYFLNAFDEQTNWLISASSYTTEARLRKNRAAIRQSADSLIFDSGVLGMAKRGILGWWDEHNRVVEMGLELGADRIAAIDVPCEPHILKKLGLTVDEAIELTTRNAWQALEDDRLNGRRIITVQGWTLDDRKRSLDQLMPVIEADPDAWIGNGTTCMLTPDSGLFKFYEWLCPALPGRHIHAWGIAQASWLAELYRLGISSCDSATAGVAGGFNEFIHPVTGKRQPAQWQGARNKLVTTGDILRNMYAMEQAFKRQSQQAEYALSLPLFGGI